MSWSNITGEQNILPSGSGVQDEVKFESGQAVKVMLVLPNGAEPYSYLEHCVEVETVENGQQVRTFRSVRCPKTSKSPNAPCPLCDGQKARRRLRHVCNVIDLGQNKIQKLNAGNSVFETIANSRKMGVDILNAMWGIMKTGQGRNDTTYTVSNLGPANVQYDPAVHGVLFDCEVEYQPPTIDEMKAIVEGAGADWNDLITPPELVFPTLQEALAHKMPNGKYKDQTFQQIWDADKSPRGFIAYLALKSERQNEEKAAAQVIYTRLGGVHIDGVPMTDGAPAQQTTAPQQSQQAPAQQQNSQPAQQSTPAPSQPAMNAPVSGDRQEKINKLNAIFSTADRYKSNFNNVIEDMKKYGNGKTSINDFTDAELDALLKGCQQ